MIKKRILMSLMVSGLLFNGICVHAAESNQCDHTNIRMFDTTSTLEDYYHWHVVDDKGTSVWCHVVTKNTFTTTVCTDCGEVLYITNDKKYYFHTAES